VSEPDSGRRWKTALTGGAHLSAAEERAAARAGEGEEAGRPAGLLGCGRGGRRRRRPTGAREGKAHAGKREGELWAGAERKRRPA
jgi:hypothetical protein